MFSAALREQRQDMCNRDWGATGALIKGAELW